MIEDVCILVVSIPIRLAPNLGACRSELKWVKGSRMKLPRTWPGTEQILKAATLKTDGMLGLEDEATRRLTAEKL